MDKQQKQKARNIMNSTMTALKKAGVFAGDLMSRLKKDDSPEAMLKTLEEGLAANRTQREQAAGRVEALHGQIVAGKKNLATASPARKKIVETELRSRLAEYKSAENQLSVLLENERVLSTVQGRLLEVVSYGLATVTEDQIDDVVDRIEEAVSEAEGRLSATRDLEKAGKRRDREQDTEQLMDELAAFDEEPAEAESSLDKELAGFDETPPPATTAKKPEVKEEES